MSVADNLGFGLRRQARVTGELADGVLPGLLVLINVTDIEAHGSGPKVQALPTPPNLTAKLRFSAHSRLEEACAPFQITAAS